MIAYLSVLVRTVENEVKYSTIPYSNFKFNKLTCNKVKNITRN